METKITSKAKELINKFNAREIALYEYIIELLVKDEEDIKKIEIAQRAGDSKTKIQEGLSKVLHGNFRAKYILQCLNIHTSVLLNTLVIDVNY